MKKLLVSIAIVLGVSAAASPAIACGYYDCQEMEFGWYCLWYED